jgi:RNA polymerase sigma factor (sigma-70 family)
MTAAEKKCRTEGACMGIGDAFADGFARFKNYLRGSFGALSEYDAEDIVQQVAVTMLCRNADSISNTTAYIYAALRNAAVSHFRKQKREAPLEAAHHETCDTPEEALLSEELSGELEDALAMLDEKSRFVFVETALYGKSYKQLSAQTGEPVGTLLARKSRAVKKLAIILDEYMR